MLVVMDASPELRELQLPAHCQYLFCLLWAAFRVRSDCSHKLEAKYIIVMGTQMKIFSKKLVFREGKSPTEWSWTLPELSRGSDVS